MGYPINLTANNAPKHLDTQNEIGIAVSHYHHKLGPQFTGISFDFSTFDSISQYNILQDSISSRSDELAIFTKSKEKHPFTVLIKKIKIADPRARGGLQRYAVVLIIPSELKTFEFDIQEISDDLQEKLQHGANIHQALQAWHTLLNDTYGRIEQDDGDLKIIRKIRTNMEEPRSNDLDFY